MKKIRITNNHGDNRIVMIPGSRNPTRLPAYGQIERTIPETVFQMVMENRLDSGILIDEIIPDIPAEPEPEQPPVSDEIVGPYPDIDPIVVKTPVVKTEPEAKPEPAKAVEKPKPVTKPATKKRGRKKS